MPHVRIDHSLIDNWVALGLTHRHLAVYVVLVRFSGRMPCRPPIRSITQRLKMSKRTVIRLLEELETAGMEIDREFGARNLYKPATLIDVVACRTSAKTDTGSLPFNGVKPVSEMALVNPVTSDKPDTGGSEMTGSQNGTGPVSGMAPGGDKRDTGLKRKLTSSKNSGLNNSTSSPSPSIEKSETPPDDLVATLHQHHCMVFGRDWESEGALIIPTPDLVQRMNQAFFLFSMKGCKDAHQGHRMECQKNKDRGDSLRLAYPILVEGGKKKTNMLDTTRFGEMIVLGQKQSGARKKSTRKKGPQLTLEEREAAAKKGLAEVRKAMKGK